MLERICLGTFSKGPAMSREDELACLRQQVSILAEREMGLLDMISKRAGRGADTTSAEHKLALLESMMWKLHRRLSRLKDEQRAA
jgi:hypothetical protein